jgi:beta-glucosidase
MTAITAQAKIDGTTIKTSLSDTNTGAAASAAAGASAALVFVTADSGEGYITVEGNAGGEYPDMCPYHGC